MRSGLVLITLGAIVVACNGDATVSTTGAPDTSTTTVGVTSTTTTPTSTTSTAPTSTTLRGEPVIGGPPSGAVLSVIGVAHDDVLNLRAGPGADQEILGTIPHVADDVVALGETRQLPAWWISVDYQGLQGWVNLTYLAYVGATTDITSNVIGSLGERPTAESMTELGLVVAESLMSTDPESDIVVVVEESIGDLGEVTYDVVGLGDDSVRGLRIHVFGEPVGGGFSLRTVESTLMCQPDRGVADDGSCS